MFGSKHDTPMPAVRRNASALAQISDRVASTKPSEPAADTPKLDPRAIEEAFFRAKARLDAAAAEQTHDDTESTTEKPS